MTKSSVALAATAVSSLLLWACSSDAPVAAPQAAGAATTAGTSGLIGGGSGGVAGSIASSSAGATQAGSAATTGGSSSGAGTSSGGATGGVANVAGSGGTGSAAAGSGSGGASGGAACPDPVTPNATPQTRKVLCYLYSIIGKKILSAQEEDNSDEGMDFVHNVSGKYPAIRAFDLNNSKAPDQCADHAKKGGLCMVGYHMGINGNFTATVNMDNVVKAGTDENTKLNARLDDVARTFDKLQAVNGVGFVRLFHEVGNGCKWFWWSESGNAQQYNALFKYAFKYLTQTKGLKNTLWIVPHCGNPNSGAWNPGKELVDIGGSDTYKDPGDYQPLIDQFKDTQKTFPGLPIALHENGPIPDPDQLQSTGAKWIMFNTWSDHFNPPNNSEDHTKKVYNHDYVITLDELPSFQ